MSKYQVGDPNTPSYIGKKECGCILAAIVDNGEHPKDVANALKEWVLEGLIIERVTCGFVRENFGYCEKHKPKKQLKLIS